MQLTTTPPPLLTTFEAFIAEACEVKGMKVVVKRFSKRVDFPC